MISVIIPTYNRYDMLSRAIDSVSNQTYKDYEIIIVDDCSTDNNYAKLKERPDIRYFRLEKRTGLCGVVRNFGIERSNGEWIAFLDDDDFWFPHKLKRQMELSGEYDFICSDAFCNDRLWIQDISLTTWNRINPEIVKKFNYDLICQTNLIIGSSVLIKKEILKNAGLLNESPLFFGMEDYMTWLEVLKYNATCFFIEEGLLEYNNLSHKYYLEKV